MTSQTLNFPIPCLKISWSFKGYFKYHDFKGHFQQYRKGFQMKSNNRQNWSHQEDEFLLKLVNQNDKKQPWTRIAQTMCECFKGKIRFGKQCRERFINYLHGNKAMDQLGAWTQEEANFMFQIYEQIGPRWTQISKKLIGKTENSVKNKFYGSLRKAIRKINRCLKTLYKKNKKQIRFESVIRILEYAQGRYRFQAELYEKSVSIRSKLMNEMKIRNQKMPNNQIQALAEEINAFSIAIRSYKLLKIPNNSLTKHKMGSITGQFGAYEHKKQEIEQKLSTFVDVNLLNMENVGSISKQNPPQFPCILFAKENQEIPPIQPGEKVEFIEPWNFLNINQKKQANPIFLEYLNFDLQSFHQSLRQEFQFKL